jgi:hypothetical protein
LEEGLRLFLENHLKKEVSEGLYNEYVFKEDYFDELIDFFENVITE